jgi:hypothetical protein
MILGLLITVVSKFSMRGLLQSYFLFLLQHESLSKPFLDLLGIDEHNPADG